jgi:tRNA pseudouridine32 synthase / 23S rRNA pseudouridine746 synthase
MQPIELEKTIQPHDRGTLCDMLAALSGLSKTKVKRAMNLGAVWLKKPGGRKLRVRRATTPMAAGDQVALYYDEAILNLQPPVAQCLRDYRRYSIWFKPAGLMTQGSRFGDHCALTRQVELDFKPQRPVLLVHRIDRETCGLVIVAHDRKAAALLAQLLRSHEIKKQYRALVAGRPAEPGTDGHVDAPLDGRPALTWYHVLAYDPGKDQSLMRIQTVTGRRHQIRRHFELIGHPVIGDPRYGQGNKNRQGLELIAYSLKFKCPITHKLIDVELDLDKPSP